MLDEVLMLIHSLRSWMLLRSYLIFYIG